MRLLLSTAGIAVTAFAFASAACQEQAERSPIALLESAQADGSSNGRAEHSTSAEVDSATIAGLRAELSEAQSKLATVQEENAELSRKLDARGSAITSQADAKPEPLEGVVSAVTKELLGTQDEPQAKPPEVNWPRTMFASPKRKFSYRSGQGEATVTVTALEWKKRKWVMNRSGYQYQYREPDKGNYYLVFDFTVATKMHDPDLPAFHVARLANNQPVTVGYVPALIEFYKWDDYGSFLGNDADYGNDFSKSDSVKFTAAVELTPEQLSEPLFLIATKEGCAPREEERFANPPVKYNIQGCHFGLKDTASPDEFWARYQLVAVHNAAKIPK